MNLIPLITEKSMKDVNLGRYTFKVLKTSDKNVIRKHIEERFSVTVTNIATIMMKGKTARVGVRRIDVKKSPWKKAIVTLKKGEKIGLFELGEDK